MEITHRFSQGNLIKNVGNQHPDGICLGLVVQWLISIHNGKIVGDEKQFWQDLNNSLANTPNVPLLGVGYARKAIESQDKYVINHDGVSSIGNYARKELRGAELKIGSGLSKDGDAFANGHLDNIADTVLNSKGRYSILVVSGANGAHAIGIYRKYSLIGKSTDTQIFDPNYGEYKCEGKQDIEQALNQLKIELGYDNLNLSYLLEIYVG